MTELYERYRPWVYRHALYVTGNETMAQDILQDSFLYLFNKFPGFKLTAKMTTFLYPVVKHRSLEMLRKQKRETTADKIPPQSVTSSMGPERVGIEDLLQGLDTDSRELLMLRFYEGCTLKEIAKILDIPTGTVKSRLHHLTSSLRRSVKK